jgi:hypothetical protein
MVRVRCYTVAGRMVRVLLLANWTGVQKSIATLLLDGWSESITANWTGMQSPLVPCCWTYGQSPYYYSDGCSGVHCYVIAGRVGRVLHRVNPNPVKIQYTSKNTLSSFLHTSLTKGLSRSCKASSNAWISKRRSIAMHSKGRSRCMLGIIAFELARHLAMQGCLSHI